MRLKAGRGLTASGKRKGRRPKYLTKEQIAVPLPEARQVHDKGGVKPEVRRKQAWRFRINVAQAKQKIPLGSQKGLAVALVLAAPNSAKTEKEVAAMAARIRRAEGNGVDKLSADKPSRRGISPKN